MSTGQLKQRILRTLAGPELTPERVILACDTLAQKLTEAEYLPMLLAAGMPERQARKALFEARLMLSRSYLEHRLEIELGGWPRRFIPYGSDRPVRQEWRPLGVLLHIAAGNMDALPAFSVIEGLLTGNINLLKLPGGGDPLSVTILNELSQIEPLIADYAMVFDLSSKDTEALVNMAELADAVVVWGGDEAVSAVRRIVQPNTRIIEWGHKISFAYVSGHVPDVALRGVARNMCETNQTLCSSCQGLFVDSEDYGDAVRLAERFIRLFDEEAKALSRQNDPFLDAQKTLELYTEELESCETDKRVFRTENCGVIAYGDCMLTTSYMFQHCWVKPLPRRRLLAELSKYKNHLQTVALLCEESERSALEALLLKTGIVRITNGDNMSQVYCGMPHDGEFALQRYVKIVSYEYE
jgi:hypothetical protein